MAGQTLHDIQLIADRIPHGGQVSGEQCPKCHGGLSGEKSLSLSRNGGTVSWYCHRASCGYRGSTGSAINSQHLDYNLLPPVAKKHIPQLYKLPESVIDLLQEKYDLTEYEIRRNGLAWSTDIFGGSLAIPLKSRWFSKIGYNFRTLRGKKRSQLILTNPDENILSYYVCPDEPSKMFATPQLPVVVVEDQLSAIKGSRYFNTVALCGTNLSPSKVVDISKANAKHVVLALDKDASHKSVDYLMKYNAFFPKLTVVQLEQDLKDSDDDYIKKLLEVK